MVFACLAGKKRSPCFQGTGRGAKCRTTTEPRVFATTRWSLVLVGAQFESGEQKAREALAELCRTYWRPIFSYVCRRGYSSEDAQDLTQDFFLMILETNWLRQADESRGRFRSFLLKSLQNFLGHAVERNRPASAAATCNLSPGMMDGGSALAGYRSRRKPRTRRRRSDYSICAGRRRWWSRPCGRLREECEAKGRLRLFETLSKHLTAERSETILCRSCYQPRSCRDDGEKTTPQSATTLSMAPA